jgi:hypothetical protein
VTQKKTGRPVQFEITEQTCNALAEWPAAVGSRRGAYLFPSRFRERPHLSTRQYARIVHRWVDRAGLDSSAYGTHSTRRTRRGPARAKPIAANPPNPIAVWRGSWRHDRPAVRLVRPRSGKSGLNLFSRAQYHGEICRSGWLSMSSAAHPLHKSPPALSYAIIGVRLGDRGSHHDTKGRFSGFMRVEPEARPRGIAAPRRCTLTVDGGGAADDATGLHRALRVRSGRTVAVAGEVADLQSA